MAEQKATEMEERILKAIEDRRNKLFTISDLKESTVADVGALLISESLDNYLESRLASDRVLEGLLADIRKEISASSQRIEEGLRNIEGIGS